MGGGKSPNYSSARDEAGEMGRGEKKKDKRKRSGHCL